VAPRTRARQKYVAAADNPEICREVSVTVESLAKKLLKALVYATWM
jgi:hypothetical protein